MVFTVLASMFLVWGLFERRRHYSDTPKSFFIAFIWAAGRIASAALNKLTGGGMHEPFSARTGRAALYCRRWGRVENMVDHLFFHKPGHCRRAWILADARAEHRLRYCLEWIWHDR